MSLPKWAITVTPLSKTIALILFITLPIIAFYFGLTFQQKVTINPPPSPFVTVVPSLIPISTPTSFPTKPSTQPENDKNGYYSWPVQKVCIPVESEKTPRLVTDLNDGTYIYRNTDGSLFRGSQNQCRCLSSSTTIDTAKGNSLVKNLKVGDLVWTLNNMNKKELQPLIKVSNISVPRTHQMSHLILSDGRELYVSPGHPTTDGRTVGELKTGDKYNSSIVKSNALVPYWDSKTYDILPAGDTGFYFANGILMGSTLRIQE